jgi:hypothetical protein
MLEYLLTLLHARFIGSVTIDESGGQVVIEKRFFGEQFLDYVDSIFFYLPFSSASEAEASKGITPTSEWNKIRDTLAADHRDPKNHAVLIQAWKDYVAKNFEQLDNSGSPGEVGNSSIFDRMDAPPPAAPPPPNAD